MRKESKIYVAGHRGLVGSAIVRKLKEKGYENIIARTSKELNLRRQADVEEFFRQETPEYVFLAAANVGGILANSTQPADFIFDNLAIETNVIQSSWLSGVKKLLFLGSSCVYPKFASQPMKESELLAGKLESTNEPYAVAKIAGITMCQAYDRQYGTNFISVMPTNLYGPNDNFDLMNSHVLPAMIRKFHLSKLLSEQNFETVRRDLEQFGNAPEPGTNKIGKNDAHLLTEYLSGYGIFPNKVVLWGSGKPRREFLHVDDLSDACMFLVNNYDDPEIINIGTGEDITIKELARIIAQIVNFEGSMDFDTSRPDGTPRKLLDVTKLHNLGWKHAIPFIEGITTTYKWYTSRLSVQPVDTMH